MDPKVSLPCTKGPTTVLSRANQFHSVTSYLFQIHFSIILAIEHKCSQITCPIEYFQLKLLCVLSIFPVHTVRCSLVICLNIISVTTIDEECTLRNSSIMQSIILSYIHTLMCIRIQMFISKYGLCVYFFEKIGPRLLEFIVNISTNLIWCILHRNVKLSTTDFSFLSLFDENMKS
jgi:hypothetical protein